MENRGKRNLGGIVDAIRVKSHIDPLSKGIWLHIKIKYSIFLWRIKNQQIKTLQMLNAWTVQIKQKNRQVKIKKRQIPD